MLTTDRTDRLDRPADLMRALRESWSADTSAAAEAWHGDCPSEGQCAVTALVVQDFLGGTLIRAVIEGTSHYWNRIDGEDLDLTRDQFGSFVAGDEAERDRHELLANSDTLLRYRILRQRVDGWLARSAG